MNKYSTMKFIHNTVSLCNECYRHIPGVVYEKEDKIYLSKLCPIHGEMEEIVEIDTEYYYNLHREQVGKFVSIMFEVTNKCQLECPHCYQLPENRSTDKPIDLLMEIAKSYPNGFMPLLAGAEPTLHKGIIDLGHQLSDSFGQVRMLTNGLKFSDYDFAKDLLSGYNILPAIGLNHYTYQGQKIHDKQVKGIRNIQEVGKLDGVGYTIEDLNHLPEIFEEILSLKTTGDLGLVRIRMGASIGRSTGERNYLSNTLKHLKNLLGDELVSTPLEDNIYHNMYNWRGIRLRIIQWPDVRSIDLEELNNGPWATFVDGPITNYIHQVILRDAFVNNNLKRYDICPEYYHLKDGIELDKPENSYWRNNFSGTIDIDKFDYTISDIRKRPKKLL